MTAEKLVLYVLLGLVLGCFAILCIYIIVARRHDLSGSRYNSKLDEVYDQLAPPPKNWIAPEPHRHMEPLPNTLQRPELNRFEILAREFGEEVTRNQERP